MSKFPGSRVGPTIALVAVLFLAIAASGAQASERPLKRSLGTSFTEMWEELRPQVSAMLLDARDAAATQPGKAQAAAVPSIADTFNAAISELNGGAMVAGVQWINIDLAGGWAKIQSACPDPLPATPVIERIEFGRFAALVWLCGLQGNPIRSEFNNSRFWLFKQVARNGRSDLIKVAGCKKMTPTGRILIGYRGCNYPKTRTIYFDAAQVIMEFTCRKLGGIWQLVANQAIGQARDNSCRDRQGPWTARQPTPPPAPPAA